ncbi:unnamed protein product, partial [marine sediment metagenome]
QNYPKINRAARVRLLGTSKLVMGAICNEMALLTPDINGHGVVAVVAAVEEYVGAIALEESTAADAGGNFDVIEVLQSDIDNWSRPHQLQKLYLKFQW